MRPVVLTDEEIVLRVQDGDIQAFGELVIRYEARLVRYAKKLLFNFNDHEDVVQEVFIKAYKNIQSFKAGSRFSPWIYRIAHNEFVNTLKKRLKEPLPFIDADAIFPHTVSREDPGRKQELKELSVAIETCLQKIPAKYREVIILFYLQELEYVEIAEILRLPVSTVGVRLKRGRESLKAICQHLNQHL
ncbi:RNA polymerase sigma factor [Candidatus Parcubacteria bacterium]|jgi:RNA polymerase sigma-70 factor (ECF subfamily)|nr:MAG: RNA polymerase sigma factor [Candidatus Parcubacteria bacterium]